MRLLAAAIFALGLSAAPAAAIETYTWAGHQASTAWSYGPNWVGGLAPTAGDGEVNLVFGKVACNTGSFPELCRTPIDDVPEMTAGTIRLYSRVERYTGSGPPSLPEGREPLTYALDGASSLELDAGIDVETTQEGAGEGVIGTGADSIEMPIRLGGPNTWNVGPAPGGLVLLGAVSGAQGLAVTLGNEDSLQLDAPVDVGPVTITEQPLAWVSISSALGGGDLNGSDHQPVAVSGGALSGGGRIGPLTLSGAQFTVGGFAAGTGNLAVEGALAMDAATSLEFVPGASLRVAGAASLGGARLLAPYACAAPGTAITLIHAAGGLSGTLTRSDGTPLPEGAILTGSASGCEGAGTPRLQIRYGADDLTATVLGPETSPVTPGEPVAVSLHAALESALHRAEHAASIRRLLHAGRETFAASVPEAGLLTVAWSARHGGHRITIARGRARAARAGELRLVLALTPAGRRLLAGARTVHGRASLAFTPTHGAAQLIAGPVVLRR